MSVLDRLRAAAGFAAAPAEADPQQLRKDGPLAIRTYAPDSLDPEPWERRRGTALADEQPVTEPAAGAGVMLSKEEAAEIAQRVVLDFLATEAADTASSAKPMAAGGRQTQASDTFNLLPNAWSPVDTDFPFPLLKIIENLCLLNRHFSYGVDNIVSLAATEMEIAFSDKIPVAAARDMRAHLKAVQASWYEFSDGGSSLTNDLLAQVCTFGCLCSEIVVKRDLSGVEYVPVVSPHTIRFILDRQTGRYKPLQQQPAGASGVVQKEGVPAGYRELNTRTFKYITMRRWKTTPYPVPPFAAAVEDVYTENDMLGSFRSMMKRLGMMGLLTVMATAPEQLPLNQETPEQYESRLRAHLQNNVLPTAQAGFSRGVVVGYKDTLEVNLEGNNMNSQGAEQFLKMIKSLVFAGLKQDPNMHGENNATTETFGRVILTKMMQQVARYQQVVASFFEQLYLTELVLAGFSPGYVQVTFKPAMIGDQKRDAETRALEILNSTNLRNQGIISQEVMAQELGYDEADQAVPPATAFPAPAAATGGTQKEGSGPSNPTPDTKGKAEGKAVSNAAANPAQAAADVARLRTALGAAAAPYSYDVPAGCRPPQLTFEADAAAGDERLQAQVRKYMREVLVKMAQATDALRPVLRRDLRALSADASLQQVQDTVQAAVLRTWQQEFASRIGAVAGKRLRSTYREFRKDTTVFSHARGYSKSQGRFYSIPAATFTQKDYRAMEYLRQLDTFYLGKFITDEDTTARILAFIEKEYFGEGSPVGKGSAALTKFLDSFADVLALESWKARRIVETTVNKTRNYANLAYIEQAGLEQFEIVEVMDRLTCGHCQHMNGQVFEVSTAAAQVDKVTSSPVGDTPELSPFATSVPLTEFQGMSAAQLQAAGFNTPSYHPHCRGRVVAVI